MKKEAVRSLEFQGLSIVVETDQSQYRHWYDPHGKERGHTKMTHPYGYISGTLGTDGDEVDVYVGPCTDSDRVFVVTQMSAPDFAAVDEQKVMLGFNDPVSAKTAYLQNFNSARFFGTVKEMTVSELKAKLTEQYGGLLKANTTLINSHESDKMSCNNMLYLDLATARLSHPPESESGSKPMNKSSSNEEALDLKKEASASANEDESVDKSLEDFEQIVKALKAAAIAGLSRQERLNAVYRLGMAQGRQKPLETEAVVIPADQLNVGIDKGQLRPSYEPPVVPLRAVETPYAIPPRVCGDHEYGVKISESQEAPAFHKRGQ